ncbi:MAG: two-component system response regulator [Candidatus Binatia bacterium]|nr:MAG: two-component system response regulator [Candidatus Binatia bacterium]
MDGESQGRILVADDDEGIRFGISRFLESRGHRVEATDTCKGVLGLLSRKMPDVAILDYRLPDGNAVDLLPKMREMAPDVPVVVLTAHGSIELAVRAIKEGAENFLTKPVEMSALAALVERLLERRKALRREGIARKSEPDPFLGTSRAIRYLAEQVRRVLDVPVPVLLHGETGTGKGLVARWIHRNGPRAAEPFVDVNCAALPRELLESELFGYERGAFTGATAPKPGLLEAADRGTVFLDEIGDMDLQVQAKLLKVLEEKRFRRLGGVGEREVDVRIVSASHQDLRRLVGERSFREDLYYRIATVPIEVPPLRNRREDIPLLARSILEGVAGELGRGEVTLGESAIRALCEYDWPGNVRELRNVLERALLLHEVRVLEAEHLRLEGPGKATDRPSGETLEEVEKAHIARILEEEQGHVPAAARRLGVPKSTLYQKIKRFGFAAGKRRRKAESQGVS